MSILKRKYDSNRKEFEGLPYGSFFLYAGELFKKVAFEYKCGPMAFNLDKSLMQNFASTTLVELVEVEIYEA